MKRYVKCPTCGKRGEWSQTRSSRPFCSERCRLLDLHEWLRGGRSIPGDTAPREPPPGDR